ncbi:MAG: hypothetical protein V3V13_10420 [Paracoccaceae bacterium]
MKNMFNTFSGVMAGLGFGGVLIFMGYRIYSGDPFSFEGDSRGRGGFVDKGQDWLIDTLGALQAGGLLMAVGAIGGVLLLKSAIKGQKKNS